MAHKTLINGTEYGIVGGKTLIGGTEYAIAKGKTLIGGTAYDINFAKPVPTFVDLMRDAVSVGITGVNSSTPAYPTLDLNYNYTNSYLFISFAGMFSVYYLRYQNGWTKTRLYYYPANTAYTAIPDVNIGSGATLAQNGTSRTANGATIAQIRFANHTPAQVQEVFNALVIQDGYGFNSRNTNNCTVRGRTTDTYLGFVADKMTLVSPVSTNIFSTSGNIIEWQPLPGQAAIGNSVSNNSYGAGIFKI